MDWKPGMAVTSGPLAAPPRQEYVRADLVPQWQPIETAPKDGTDVMVWDGEVRTLSTWGKTAHVPIYGWLQIAWADPEDADLMYPQPTHWMPLPSAQKIDHDQA
jgi:hypothetical protein